MPIYVYALTQSDAASAITSGAVASGGAVTRIDVGTLSALVSDITETEILPTRRNAIAHARVLEEAMASAPILPMRFGIIVDSLDTLVRVVETRTQQLHALLAELDGHIEVGLKAQWNQDLFWRDFAVAHPELNKLGQRLNAQDQSKTYYDRIELGRKIEAAIKEQRKAAHRRLLETIGPYARKMKDLPPADDLSVANMALLISAAEEAQLFDRITALEKDANNRLDIKFVSPVPAYNFVSVSLDWSNREVA